ncbi:DUF3445 domain-containing protein [Ponticaulis sp.]|uniref:heme-dependent oxidative N-demethylase family protein n=1 Tax=Ponticaulis sp. TaxID=2020902 RepID=UPI000B6A03C3|nr:DUF3445 domain-containing protein [Ponticaulis sp.]MAI90770.1 hypothetical protein [Ponticaulis sp.]OUX98995.1 MAG: hypothetical protein CBB65_10040 [Hyphomonadaceae bacterium TMED5]|tara:strand:+ start:53304 stop:54128 length:825 start_codon:yes stop_codon:yes gene_type:complete
MRKPPYLPFLDGPARMAPQLKPIFETGWLSPDTEADVWLEEKRALMREKRDQVYAETDGSHLAVEEAASLIRANLGFETPSTGTYHTALERAAALVSDDVCVMVERDGAYCLGAASLCAPTFWSLQVNIGKPLGGLHHALPGEGVDLSSRINRIFSGLQPDIILERFNWTVQYGAERFTPSSASMKARLASLTASEAANQLHLRVERQTVRKLPETGAVLFTIRICVDPLPAILANATHKTAFAESWRETASDVAGYKGWPHYQPAIDWLLSQA